MGLVFSIFLLALGGLPWNIHLIEKEPAYLLFSISYSS